MHGLDVWKKKSGCENIVNDIVRRGSALIMWIAFSVGASTRYLATGVSCVLSMYGSNAFRFAAAFSNARRVAFRTMFPAESTACGCPLM
jgi:hypothetical protein